MTSLRQAAVRGAVWSTLSTVLNRGLRFATTIVLARILTPEDFGLVAMSTLVMEVADLLRDLGLGAALIQRKQLDPEHLTTCFWTNVAVGALLWALTVAIAPLMAWFYRSQAVQPVLAVMAFNFLIAPIGSVPWVLLNRELRFKELMIAQSVSTVVRGAASLLLAWQGAGVWSLVWGPLAGTAAGSVINWWLCPWRPGLGWSRRHFRELFRFGRNVFGEKFLGYFSGNSDYVVTGRFLGAQMLGFYNFAYEIPHLAQTHLAPIINRVLFPVLSHVQDDPARFLRGYLQSLRWVAVAAAPFSVGLFVTAPEFILTLYGAKWQPVVVPLQILCGSGLLHALTAAVWTVQQAAGRPEIGFRWDAATLPFILVVLIVSAPWGITAIAASMLVLCVILSTAIQHITNRLIGLRWAQWVQVVRGPVVAAAGMGIVVAGCRVFLLTLAWRRSFVLGVCVAVGMAAYAGLLLWQEGTLIDELRGLLQWKRARHVPVTQDAPIEVSPS